MSSIKWKNVCCYWLQDKTIESLFSLDSKHNRMHKMFDWRAFDTTWYGVVFSGHAEQIFESF